MVVGSSGYGTDLLFRPHVPFSGDATTPHHHLYSSPPCSLYYYSYLLLPPPSSSSYPITSFLLLQLLLLPPSSPLLLIPHHSLPPYYYSHFPLVIVRGATTSRITVDVNGCCMPAYCIAGGCLLTQWSLKITLPGKNSWLSSNPFRRRSLRLILMQQRRLVL